MHLNFFVETFFYVIMSSCSQLTKILGPGQTIYFNELVSADDMYINFSAGLISVGDNVFYKIHSPDSQEKKRKNYFNMTDSENSMAQDDSFSKDDDLDNILPRNLIKQFSTPGMYIIQIHNRGDEEVKFSINSYVVKKVSKGNDDVTALRNVLTLLQTAIGVLGNENYYAKDIQSNNIREVKRINKLINFLSIYPMVIVAFGFAKDYFARQLVRPVGKRFHGLF